MRQLLPSSAMGLALNLVVTPMLVGYIELCLDCLAGRAGHVSALLAAFSRFGAIAPLVIVGSVLGFAYNSLSLLLLTPSESVTGMWPLWLVATPLGVYVAVSLGFSYAVLAEDHEAGPLDALKRSFRLTTGHRLRILAVLLLSALVVMGSAMMCFLPILAGVPIASLAWSGCYLALTKPSSPPTATRSHPPR
jgi:hypothetical protein